MLINIFTALLITSSAGLVMTFIILIIKKAIGNRFSRNWHCYVWAAVLLVMMIPVRFSVPQINADNADINLLKEKNIIVYDTQNNERIPAIQNLNESRAVQEVIRITQTSVFDILSYVWLIGAVFLLVRRLTMYFVFCTQIDNNSYSAECLLIKEYTKRNIRVRRSVYTASPLMYGYIKPTLILPEKELDEDRLKFVVLHELSHLKRYDIIYKWFGEFVAAVHWFNPVVYYIRKQINNECELACDCDVIKNMTTEEKLGYVDTILSLLSEASDKETALTTSMANNKKLMQKRFVNIREFKRTGKFVSGVSFITSILVSLIIVCCGGVVAECILPGNTSVTNIVWPCPDNENISRRYSDITGHTGIDIAAPKGATVVAAFDGVVKEHGFDTVRGSFIVIKNNSGMEAAYHHLSAIHKIAGEHVKTGESIGAVGSTGMATGPHLHFEIKTDSQFSDPCDFFSGSDYDVSGAVNALPPLRVREMEFEYQLDIEDEIKNSHKKKNTKGTLKLSDDFGVYDYNFDIKEDLLIKLYPDRNGRAMLVFETGFPEAVCNVMLTANEKEDEIGVVIPTNNHVKYIFEGLKSDKEYTLRISGYYPGNYGIKGRVLIY